MADAAASLGQKAAGAGYHYARRTIMEQNRGQYNEEDIKAQILSVVEQNKEDTKAPRNMYFKTARDQIKLWINSPELTSSQHNMDRLRTAVECAAKAFHSVSDPMDKATAARFQIYATYYYVSLTSMSDDASQPNWASGKREAQNVLKTYIGSMKELSTAAHEELGAFRRRIFKDKEKRRKLLCAFVDLSASVFALPPRSLNGDHPRFEELEEAARKAYRKRDKTMWPERVVPFIISEPLEIDSLRGHTNAVNCCAVLAEGSRAISASWDGTLKVWNLERGEEVHTLRGHTGPVYCCAVLRDGSRAISGGDDGTLKVWDLERGEEVHTLRGHTGWVYCCAVLADGSRAISGSRDGTLKVWDLERGEDVHTLRGHTDWVYCCAVLVDGSRVISGSSDGTLRLWHLEKGEVHTLRGHTGPVLCCAVLAEGSRVISGSADGTLKVWGLEKGEEVHTLRGHTDTVRCCTVLADGLRAISGSADGTLKVWDLEKGEEIHTLRGHTGPVGCCAALADGSRLISGSRDGTLKVWDLPVAPLPSVDRIEEAVRREE